MRCAGLIGAVAAVLGVAGGAAAQPATPAEVRQKVTAKWKELHKTAEEQLRLQESGTAPTGIEVVQQRDVATRQASIIAAVDAVEPDDSTAAATVRRLAGAIKTNPEGTEAGIVVAPFALAGLEGLRGFEVTLAALAGDLTRTGASYTWDRSATLEDVWEPPKACKVTPARLKSLEKPREFYLRACTDIVAVLPEPERVGVSEREQYRREIEDARSACGLVDPERVRTLPEALALLTSLLVTVDRIDAQADDVIPSEAALLVVALRSETVSFENWTIASSTSCYDKKSIQGHLLQLYWKRAKVKLAASASWDLYPRKWGFSPDDSRLPKGDIKTEEARFALSIARRATELSVGIGVGRGRTELADPLRRYVGPTVSFAHAISLPGVRSLEENGELNVDDGKLPPRLVLGISMALQRAIDKPDEQETDWNAVKIQPHVDFVVNETLSFRLGVPVVAEIATRKAKAAQPETPTSPAVAAVEPLRRLQWKVPVAIVAVLKL